jgi:hypothetical protein
MENPFGFPRKASLTHLRVQPSKNLGDTLSLDNGGVSGPDYSEIR